MLLHVLGHVDPDHRVLGVEHELGERAGELGLADAGRAEEQERADRPVGILEAGAGAPQRRGDRLDGLVLADHPLVQALLHVDELLDLALEQPRDRHAGPLRDDLGDVLGVDDVLEELRAVGGRPRPRLGLGGGLQLLLELGDRPVLELGRAAEIGLALSALELGLRLLELLLELGDGADGLLLALPLGVHRGRALAAPRRARARAARGARWCRGSSSSSPSDWSSISSCMMCRSTSSISVGLESISIRIRDAASSTRSIALSGRKRSAM